MIKNMLHIEKKRYFYKFFVFCMRDVDAEILEFFSYVKNTADGPAKKTVNPLIWEIHKEADGTKESREMDIDIYALYYRQRKP